MTKTKMNELKRIAKNACKENNIKVYMNHMVLLECSETENGVTYVMFRDTLTGKEYQAWLNDYYKWSVEEYVETCPDYIETVEEQPEEQQQEEEEEEEEEEEIIQKIKAEICAKYSKCYRDKDVPFYYDLVDNSIQFMRDCDIISDTDYKQLNHYHSVIALNKRAILQKRGW